MLRRVSLWQGGWRAALEAYLDSTCMPPWLHPEGTSGKPGSQMSTGLRWTVIGSAGGSVDEFICEPSKAVSPEKQD